MSFSVSVLISAQLEKLSELLHAGVLLNCITLDIFCRIYICQCKVISCNWRIIGEGVKVGRRSHEKEKEEGGGQDDKTKSER